MKNHENSKHQTLAQTELTSEVFIASTSKSETDNVIVSTKSHQGGLKQISMTEIQNTKQIE